jgi:hypothetical protein
VAEEDVEAAVAEAAVAENANSTSLDTTTLKLEIPLILPSALCQKMKSIS